MTGYLGMFLLAWFLGWAISIVISIYLLYRIALYYGVFASVAEYWQHLITFEENLEVAAR